MNKSRKNEGRRGRKPGTMSAEDKAAMAEGRKARGITLNTLNHSASALKPDFWSKVDPERAEKIVAAIAQVGETVKAEQIAALEAKLASLKGETATA